MDLIWLGCAWLAGLGLAPLLAGQGVLLALGMTATAALTALYPEWRHWLARVALGLVVLALGVWRGLPQPGPPSDLPAGPLEAVRGVVIDWPAAGNRATRAVVQVDEARVGGQWRGATARVAVEAVLYPALWRGDRVEFTGYYRAAEHDLPPSVAAALRRRGLQGQFRAYSQRVLAPGARDDPGARRARLLGAIEEALRRQLPQPEAGLVTGVLLGDARLLPATIRARFNDTGTAHVMALSGWNIALVAGLCVLLGQRLGRQRSWSWLAGSAGVVWLYTLLVGGGPTIVRAAIMGSLYLLATALGRRGDALTALLSAAFLMTVVAPETLRDVGFQLSCAATAGLVLCSGRLARALRWLPPVLAEGLAATLAAELFTLPLALHYFGRFSTVTLPANLLIEPLVPLVMAGGVATVLASSLPGPLGALAGLLTWVPARLMLLIVERFGALPWATVTVGAPPASVVALLYAAIGVALATPAWWPRVHEAGSRLLACRRAALVPLLGGLVTGLTLAAWGVLLLGGGE